MKACPLLKVYASGQILQQRPKSATFLSHFHLAQRKSRSIVRPLAPLSRGDRGNGQMAEWFKAHAWNACIESSNLSLSAITL